MGRVIFGDAVACNFKRWRVKSQSEKKCSRRMQEVPRCVRGCVCVCVCTPRCVRGCVCVCVCVCVPCWGCLETSLNRYSEVFVLVSVRWKLQDSFPTSLPALYGL